MRCLWVAVALLSLAGPAVAQPTLDPTGVYIDENGEEVFGPGYMPRSSERDGLPLYIARPNAGLAIPTDLLLFSQDAFKPSGDLLSLPVEPLQRQIPVDLPLLRSVRALYGSQPASLQPLNGVGPSPVAAGMPPMKVHFVFVGQGAGAIVELPCGLAVIDVGGGRDGVDGPGLFAEYLLKFLEEHPQYDNRINALYLSHAHDDHILGTKKLMELFDPSQIDGFVDNGQEGDLGGLRMQAEFHEWAESIPYAKIEFEDQSTASGATNSAVDPFECATISAFWGATPKAILGTQDAFNNPNNHSVLVRIDYGQASFLFLGDLMDKGIEALLGEYEENPGVLDADVLLVSHHGARGDTSDPLLKAVSPEIAVISMGRDDGTGSRSAKAHGHPNVETLAILQEEPSVVADLRPDAPVYWGSSGADQPFEDVVVERAVYGTGWEGTIVITATADGTYEIEKLGF